MDNCKGKENKYAKEHIKEIQNTYKQEDIVMKIPQTIDKGKQREEEEEVFLYKYMKYMQSPIKTMPFYPPLYYKSLQHQGEQDEQY